MSATLSRGLDPANPASSAPVLAIVDLERPSSAVLRRAAAAATALGTGLQVLLLEPRLGFTTSPRLAEYAARRTQSRLLRSRRALADILTAPEVTAAATVVRYSTRGEPAGIWRAVSACIRRGGARLVVAPEHLRHRRTSSLAVEVLFVGQGSGPPEERTDAVDGGPATVTDG